MQGGEPERPAPRRVSRGLIIYSSFLFSVGLVTAIITPYPFAVIAWGVAAVSAAFLAFFVVIPSMRGPGS